MIVRILIGALVGAIVGFGANYLCRIAGGACPLMRSKMIAILLWTLIGALFAAGFRK